MTKKKLTIRALCEGAILIAVAQILSLIPLWKYPWGGSVDLAMLPILLFCVRWGFGPAVIACSALVVAVLSASVRMPRMERPVVPR